MKKLDLIKEIAGRVPDSCRVLRCMEQGCEVRLEGISSRPHRLAIDLNCKELGIRHKKRCDYLFVAHTEATIYVALIELKSGRVDSATEVTQELQGGADHLAAKLLPSNTSFQFRPILAYRKMHKEVRNQLREKTVRLHGRKEPIKLIDCGSKLIDVFA